MKQFYSVKAQQWVQSAELSNPLNGEFFFEVTNEQKEYMEDHISEVDEKLKHMIGVVPHTIKFEPFWNGIEDGYMCECYYDEAE